MAGVANLATHLARRPFYWYAFKMLRRINRLKRLGLVYQDFTWVSDLSEFNKVNLIYGWNGCGKTTLTRLFDMLASGDCGDTEFEVLDDSGTKLVQGQAAKLPIKVFNQDYVTRNISVENSTANTISILLGDQNKELAEQITQDSKRLHGDGADIGLFAKIAQEKEKHSRLTSKTNRLFTDIARTISAALAGSTAASRTYRAPNAKSDFESITITGALTEEELAGSSNLLSQDVLPAVSEVTGPSIEADGRRHDSLKLLNDCVQQGVSLCKQTVAAVAIDRLVANPDVAEWVAAGMDLHSKHDSSVCEYCGNEVSLERLNVLANHFNEADRNLKRQIEQALSDLRQAYSAIDRWLTPDPVQLYAELRENYHSARQKFSQSKSALVDEIEAFGRTLNEKQLTTTSEVKPAVVPSAARLTEDMAVLNKIIREHNAKTKEFEERQRAALTAIKAHYLSTIEEEVKANETALQSSNEIIEALQAEANKTDKRLKEARAQISSAHKACEDINLGLKSFLGRDELEFVPAAETSEEMVDSAPGYQILRHGKPATSLSEGEKTAIALIYFVVHLQDGQTPISDTVVVIDDPVSSLDSNSMYQAFSFLKNAVKDCHQVFIFTHNFEFLRQLLNWCSRMKKKDTSYYMLKNEIRAGQRAALICELDKTLQKYETEYLFLFKTLRSLAQENDGTILTAYPIPNMARKLWETFIMFRVPVGANTYNRMEQLKKEGFDAQKLDAIYKFTNDQSHITGGGLDPSLVPESDKVLANIFEIMAQAAPRHFEHLETSLDG